MRGAILTYTSNSEICLVRSKFGMIHVSLLNSPNTIIEERSIHKTRESYNHKNVTEINKYSTK